MSVTLNIIPNHHVHVAGVPLLLSVKSNGGPGEEDVVLFGSSLSQITGYKFQVGSSPLLLSNKALKILRVERS